MLLDSHLSSGVLTWTISDPKHGNALGLELYNDFASKLSELELELAAVHSSQHGQASVKALVVRALPCGKRETPLWIAGGNLKDLNQLKTKSEGHQYAMNYACIGRRIMALPVPVVMAIDGLVVGGGIELILFADIRIASHRSRFHFKQLSMGLSAGFASTTRLSQIVGLGRCSEYMLLEKNLSAEEARGDGLITSQVPSGLAYEDEIQKISSQLASKDAKALAVQKEMLNRALLADKTEVFHDLKAFRSLWMEPRHREGLEGFASRS